MEEKRNGRRIILFPLPIQGCVSPMLQLAKILYSRGFSINVIHTRFNAPEALNHPLFTFFQIPDDLSESQASTRDVPFLLALLNRNCESPFQKILAKLFESYDFEKKEGDQEKNTGAITCLISDTGWLFVDAVAASLKLPRLVLNTYKASFFLAHTIIPDLRLKGYLPVQESEAKSLVLELPPLIKKDLPWLLAENAELQDPHLVSMVKTTKASSGLILMSCEELDENSLAHSHEVFQVPIFPIGPFHSYFPASSSSLFAQDENCIPWLDKQEDKSVIYVSFGSISTINKSEFLEIAWGLRNSDQPFLWAIRPDFVCGSKWIDLLPKEYFESLNGRGKIAKWAPQQDVLAHRATGGFLTHNGWNSVLESICEGVPMICHPCRWDQMLNARFVSEVWRVGLQLESRFDRREIERIVRRLMLEREGEEVRTRMKLLKEKVEKSLREGGSSHRSLENLVDHLLSF